MKHRTATPPLHKPPLLWGLLASLLVMSGNASAAPIDTWATAGQQGLVRFIIVPMEHASDRSAYERQILNLCDPERTCFLNFYTNSTAATQAVPLPDAIASEATATYRRSMKNGVQMFKWSCRLKLSEQDCF